MRQINRKRLVVTLAWLLTIVSALISVSVGIVCAFCIWHITQPLGEVMQTIVTVAVLAGTIIYCCKFLSECINRIYNGNMPKENEATDS